ncbi:MAG TPA: hypothetical protein VLJ37_01525 [bacterium]|nr:hypothetical protein [bacterium]
MKESITLKDVFTIVDRPQNTPEGKDRWTKVGIGFVNRDNSINVVLDAIPLNGRLQIRDRKAFPQKTQQPSES